MRHYFSESKKNLPHGPKGGFSLNPRDSEDEWGPPGACFIVFKCYHSEKARINPFLFVITVDSHAALEVGGKGILESGCSLLFLFWPDIRGLKVTRGDNLQWCRVWFWKCWYSGCSGCRPSAAGWQSCTQQSSPGRTEETQSQQPWGPQMPKQDLCTGTLAVATQLPKRGPCQPGNTVHSKG